MIIVAARPGVGKALAVHAPGYTVRVDHDGVMLPSVTSCWTADGRLRGWCRDAHHAGPRATKSNCRWAQRSSPTPSTSAYGHGIRTSARLRCGLDTIARGGSS